jgi:hypothetical protein
MLLGTWGLNNLSSERNYQKDSKSLISWRLNRIIREKTTMDPTSWALAP